MKVCARRNSFKFPLRDVVDGGFVREDVVLG
jgi:hypothetical protein